MNCNCRWRPFSRFICILAVLFGLSLIYLELAAAESGPTLDQRRQSVLVGIKNFLNQIPVIRIPITRSPGNGHQSSNIVIVERLRNLGFENTIEVLYEPVVASKLEILVKGFDAKKLNGQNFPELKLRFLPFDPYKIFPGEKAILGISAGNDTPIQNPRIGVSVLLNLQPFRWQASDARNLVVLEEMVGPKEKVVASAWLDQLAELGHVFELPKPTDLTEFLNENHVSLPELSAKNAGLYALLSSKGKFELLPVYGHEIRKVSQLLRLLSGLSAAQAAEPNLFNGGVVLPVFNSVKDSFATEVAEKAEDAGLNVKVLNILDSDFNEKLAAIQTGDIVVVLIGRVAKAVFEYFYSKSTLPPVVEGVNSINVMQLIGRPYLTSTWRVTDSYHFEGSVDLQNLLPSEQLAYELAMDAHKEMILERNSHMAIAKFISSAKRPDSDLNAFFKRFSLDAKNDIFQDKLLRGLFVTRRMIQKWEHQFHIQLVPRSCGQLLVKP